MDNVYFNFLYALIAVILYNVKTKHPSYLKVLSPLYLLLFFSDIIFEDYDKAAAKVLWMLTSTSIIIISVLRIRSKEEFKVFELIKLGAAILILTVPITFYDIANLWGSKWLIILRSAIIPILFSIYIYDRFILRKNEDINSRMLFTLIIQTIFIIGLIVYIIDQQTEIEFMKIEHTDELYKKDIEIDRLKNRIEKLE